jgi:hypothetical protein
MNDAAPVRPRASRTWPPSSRCPIERLELRGIPHHAPPRRMGSVHVAVIHSSPMCASHARACRFCARGRLLQAERGAGWHDTARMRCAIASVGVESTRPYCRYHQHSHILGTCDAFAPRADSAVRDGCDERVIISALPSSSSITILLTRDAVPVGVVFSTEKSLSQQAVMRRGTRRPILGLLQVLLSVCSDGRRC